MPWRKNKPAYAGKILTLPDTLAADGQGMVEVQAWQALLAGKGLAAAFDALEAYGMSCEDEVSLLRETDLMSTLDMQLNPLHENTSVGE